MFTLFLFGSPTFLFCQSAISPWLVFGLLVMLMRRVGKLSAPASTFNRTLIMLWPNEEEEVLHYSQDQFLAKISQVRSYLAKKYPSCGLVR